jgi:SHS2 domain-containing protein
MVGWTEGLETGEDAVSAISGRPEPRAAGHELVDHTSEVTIRLRAQSFPELLEEATRAFVELVPASLLADADDEWRSFRIQAPDRAASLVEWLNELVYRSEVDQWLPTEVDVATGGEGELHIRARGVTLSAPFVLVKAATLHGAVVREDPRGLEGEVTLDV